MLSNPLKRSYDCLDSDGDRNFQGARVFDSTTPEHVCGSSAGIIQPPSLRFSKTSSLRSGGNLTKPKLVDRSLLCGAGFQLLGFDVPESLQGKDDGYTAQIRKTAPSRSNLLENSKPERNMHTILHSLRQILPIRSKSTQDELICGAAGIHDEEEDEQYCATFAIPKSPDQHVEKVNQSNDNSGSANKHNAVSYSQRRMDRPQCRLTIAPMKVTEERPDEGDDEEEVKDQNSAERQFADDDIGGEDGGEGLWSLTRYYQFNGEERVAEWLSEVREHRRLHRAART